MSNKIDNLKMVRYKDTLEFLNSTVFKSKLMRHYFISNIFLVSTKSPVVLSSGFASIL